MWKYEAVGLMPCGAGTETLCWVLMTFGKEEASGRGFHKFTVDVRDLRGLWPGDRKSSHLSFVTRGEKMTKRCQKLYFVPAPDFLRTPCAAVDPLASASRHRPRGLRSLAGNPLLPLLGCSVWEEGFWVGVYWTAMLQSLILLSIKIKKKHFSF